MKIINTLFFSLLITFSALSQVVTTDPAFPVTNQSALVTFDATQGNGGLAGYTGDVYAHTGVLTEESQTPTDWRYVKSGWGVNIPETKMNRIASDLYTLEITPSIREYYGVPQDEEILSMAFVFRSSEEVGGQWLEGKTETGGDIFVDVTEPGLNLTFLQPVTTPVLVALNEPITIEVQANEAEQLSLFVEDILISQTNGNYLFETYTPESIDMHWIRAVAENNEGSVADSFYFHVRPEVVIEMLPGGVRDGINYTSDTSVVLSLLAPGKQFVYVIGDFNNWEIDNHYYMKMTPDSLRFWLEIGGLTPGQEYIFQYYIDGEVKVGDPYADKTSDPWNDHDISEQTYPGLIDYPAGKTEGIATVLQTAQEAYPWQVENFVPAKTTDLVIYEMLVRDFTTRHSYAAVTDTLDYLVRLGVNVLELMPVNEFEGNSSWGYNPSFYFAPDKYYGPKNELKRLIDECHKRGIAVVLDMVLNHSYDQSPLVQMYFDGNNPTPDNPWYNSQHNFTNTAAQWGNDFNHESIYTQNFIDSVNSYWMSEYRFDGFRFDFTKGFSNTLHTSNDPWGSNYDADRIAILKRMADEIWKRNEDAIVIFEHLAENSEEKVLANYGILLWGNANYNYAEASMGYNENGKSDFSWVSYKKRNWNDPHVVGYMESHDEERIMVKNILYGDSSGYYNLRDTTRALDRIRLVSAFFYTIPGPKMIWQFGELGYDYSIDYNGRLGEKPVRWDYYSDWRRNYNYHFISSLINLRVNYDVFETDDYILNVAPAMKSIKLFGDDMDVVIVGNFGLSDDVIAPGFGQAGAWYEFFTGDTLLVEDVNMELSLRHGEYRLYTDLRVAPPDIGTGIADAGAGDDLVALLYPNPVTSSAHIAVALPHAAKLKIDVYDLLGSKHVSLREKGFRAGSHTIELDLQALVPGIYFCVINANGSRETIKIIKQ